MKPSIRLRLGQAALLCLCVLGLEGHVTIAPGDVVAGASTRFTVKVPSERPEATVKLRLEFPEGLGAPRFLAKTGWAYELEKDASGRITAVTWSGGEIGPDEFDEFVFTARAPGAAGVLAFKAYQTYKGGEVVAWAGAADSPGPAPTVVVKDSASAMPAPAVTEATNAAASGFNWMGTAALALSVVALSLALRRRG